MAGVWSSLEAVLLCPGLVLLKAFSQCRKECTLDGEGKDERRTRDGRRRTGKMSRKVFLLRLLLFLWDERRRTRKRSRKVETIEQQRI